MAALVTQLEMQVSRPVSVAVVEDTSAHETVTSRALTLANIEWEYVIRTKLIWLAG